MCAGVDFSFDLDSCHGKFESKFTIQRERETNLGNPLSIDAFLVFNLYVHKSRDLSLALFRFGSLSLIQACVRKHQKEWRFKDEHIPSSHAIYEFKNLNLQERAIRSGLLKSRFTHLEIH